MKALIRTWKNRMRHSEGKVGTIVDFPLIMTTTFDQYEEHDPFETTLAGIDVRDITSVKLHVIPEEEYFLVRNGERQDYIIPSNKLKEWDEQRLALRIDDYMPKEFAQYKKEGDWEKEYKITKR